MGNSQKVIMRPQASAHRQNAEVAKGNDKRD
jgi:hypothetical protein